MLRGHEHIGLDLFGRVAHRAESLGFDAGIRRRTIGGTSVERTVGDEFHRAYMSEPVTAGQLVAGMPAIVDGLMQPFRVHARLNPQTVDAVSESTDPCIDVFGHFVIPNADDALACGVVFGFTQQTIQFLGRTRRIIKTAVRVEPFQFAYQTGFADLHAKLVRRRRIHPTAMHIRAGQRHGLIARNRIDGGKRGLFVIGPQRMTEPHAHHIPVRIQTPFGSQLRHMAA